MSSWRLSTATAASTRYFDRACLGGGAGGSGAGACGGTGTEGLSPAYGVVPVALAPFVPCPAPGSAPGPAAAPQHSRSSTARALRVAAVSPHSSSTVRRRVGQPPLSSKQPPVNACTCWNGGSWSDTLRRTALGNAMRRPRPESWSISGMSRRASTSSRWARAAGGRHERTSGGRSAAPSGVQNPAAASIGSIQATLVSRSLCAAVTNPMTARLTGSQTAAPLNPPSKAAPVARVPSNCTQRGHAPPVPTRLPVATTPSDRPPG
ncbi:hypothetical protein SSPIM334S_07252 [Streptomyces spiroverticillatus]